MPLASVFMFREKYSQAKEHKLCSFIDPSTKNISSLAMKIQALDWTFCCQLWICLLLSFSNYFFVNMLHWPFSLKKKYFAISSPNCSRYWSKNLMQTIIRRIFKAWHRNVVHCKRSQLANDLKLWRRYRRYALRRNS